MVEKKDNIWSGIFSDNPNDTMKYMDSCDAGDVVDEIKSFKEKYLKKEDDNVDKDSEV